MRTHEQHNFSDGRCRAGLAASFQRGISLSQMVALWTQKPAIDAESPSDLRARKHKAPACLLFTKVFGLQQKELSLNLVRVVFFPTNDRRLKKPREPLHPVG